MKHRIQILALIICVAAASRAAVFEPFCDIVTYDENDGLSQHLVKQIVEDADGMMWFATWNGINRFDGHEFAALRPGVDDEVRRYSSRFRDIKLSSDGNIWCRIDEKIVSLDTRTYRFADVHTQIERMIGREFEVTRWWQTEDDDLVIDCGDGNYIVIPEKNFSAAGVVSESPSGKPRSLGRRAFESLPGFPNLAYSRRDADGTLWALTKDGAVVCADTLGAPLRVLADLKLADGSARYCTTDSEGNVWFVSNKGAHCLTLGRLPFQSVKEAESETVIALASDSRGRIWTADRNLRTVKLLSPSLDIVGYLAPDGSVSREFKSFGSPVYCIQETPGGIVWLGSKPDGLFRLTPSGSGYDVLKINAGSVYDVRLDSKGRLWVATLGSGVKIIEEPFGDRPRVSSLVDNSGFPAASNACRRLISLGDTVMLAASTGGLLSIDIAEPSSTRLYATQPGDSESLGCIAVMDVLAAPDGRLLVATESDAVNVGIPDGVGRGYRFMQLPLRPSTPSEVALSLTDNADETLVVSHNLVYTFDREGNTRVFGPTFWHGSARFRETRPLRLTDGRWVFALEDGLRVSRLERDGSQARPLRPVFTSVSIENRPDSLLPPSSRQIVLGKDERNLTLRFSALVHSGRDEIVYESRVDGGEWSRLGSERSVTILDLDPGTFTVEIRAVDISGARQSSVAQIELIVKPKWHETITARLLFALLIIAAVVFGIRLALYVRNIKRKQKETLEAYMNLLANGMSPAPAETPGGENPDEALPAAESTPRMEPELTEADRQFMDKIVEYVNSHLSDPDAGVDGMADAAMVSRSGLSRKMRSITGVSPADFLKHARLSHAATLLSTTQLSVKEIAFDCGFADLNYFGKCFKSVYSLTPTAFRKSESS
ncbi:MAG: helix-turn-helix domain-containing protein [Duncaniella sp.]|nr:helix-turn-helix domain-containing protein [Duncaniella sp.]